MACLRHPGLFSALDPEQNAQARQQAGRCKLIQQHIATQAQATAQDYWAYVDRRDLSLKVDSTDPDVLHYILAGEVQLQVLKRLPYVEVRAAVEAQVKAEHARLKAQAREEE